MKISLTHYAEQIKDIIASDLVDIEYEEIDGYKLPYLKFNKKNMVDEKLYALLKELLHNYLMELVEKYKKQNTEGL